jgi:hypothetical protein
MAKIKWKFIVQIIPWQGGIYECLVSLVKQAFRTTIGRRNLTKEEMRTFTVEVEASLNIRPLTFVSTESDGFLPLRPVDFLNPHADFTLGFPGERAPGKNSS